MSKIIRMLALLSCFTLFLSASELNTMMRLGRSSSEWIVNQGLPVYYSADSYYRNLLGEPVGPKLIEGSEANLVLSPTGKYRLISLLQPLDQIKEGLRYTDYYVYDTGDNLVFTVSRGTGPDLKAHVAAVSDEGVLALIDPVNATIALYTNGDLIAETQIYATEGDYSLERKALATWVGNRCHILIERPGRNGSGAQSAIHISINSDGEDQITRLLPFTYILQYIFNDDHYFISGYSYNPAISEFTPLILAFNAAGKVLWTNENFGHELALSKDRKILAARRSHDAVIVFNIDSQRVDEIRFEKDSKVALGLTLTNAGQIALIRVATDFFVNMKSHHAEIFFPRSGKSVDVQLDPHMPYMFKLHSDGNRILLGTQFEWLEIRE